MSKKKTYKSSIQLFGLTLQLRSIQYILFTISFLLYANTLTHDYAVDDAIVIYENMYVKDGVAGIPGLLSKDTFFGFFKTEGKAKLVSGGRYRPFTPIMFAFEWQLFGKNPFVSHLINILLFAFLVVFLFKTLFTLFKDSFEGSQALLIAFFTSVLFASHPIHTECVANIKGRDEIMALLASVSALYLILKYLDSKKLKYLLLSGIVFFIGLMSKENTITFLAVIPLALLLFRRQTIGSAIKSIMPLLISTIAFLGIRTSVLGLDFGGAPMELMNNPFLKLVNNSYVPFSFSEKFATITFTLGKYISLLFFPHPLTHDYYPRHIEMMTWSNVSVLLSLFMYAVLIFVAIRYFKKNKIISFGILYFLITLSIVSNVVFPIGTNMGERFMFMPSVGFCLIVAYLISKIQKSNLQFLVLAVITLLLSVKTITRNTVWKNDFTLFTTDVKISKRSAKLLNAAGGALSTAAADIKNETKRVEMLNQANGYLQEAVKIHPNYKNAHLLLGNVNFYLQDYPAAIQHYDNTLKIDPNYKEANKNIGIALRDAGRYFGEEKNDLSTAKKYLDRSYSLNKTDYETVRLLGIVNGVGGNVEGAVRFFKEAAALEPGIAQSYVNLGTAYKNAGDEALANENFQKALELDANSLDHLRK